MYNRGHYGWDPSECHKDGWEKTEVLRIGDMVDETGYDIETRTTNIPKVCPHYKSRKEARMERDEQEQAREKQEAETMTDEQLVEWVRAKLGHPAPWRFGTNARIAEIERRLREGGRK